VVEGVEDLLGFVTELRDVELAAKALELVNSHKNFRL
jgi:hypothetical protein